MKLIKNLLLASLILMVSVIAYLSYGYFTKNCISSFSSVSPISLVNIAGSQILVDRRAANPVLIQPHVSTIITKLLRPGDNVLQVGGGIGYDSVMMGKIIGPKGRLFLFQPNDDALFLLKNNLKINDVWSNSYVFAQAPFNNDADILMETYEQNFNYYRLLKNSSDATGGMVRQVKAVKIDNTLVRDYVIDLIHLNCHGSELQVLMGAQSIIQNSPNLSILMNWDPKSLGRYSDINSIINNLIYLRFEFWDVSNPDKPMLLTKDKLLKKSFQYLIVTKDGIYRN